MAKKLRVAAAGVTDVGRRRERNQDNVTHLVPPDEDTLAAKGALFVVCDGMGGHAAGEVASELGVKAIREEYFATDETDIIKAFAHAIKQANQAIFSYAREHAEMTGMGTTCVALVLHGGRAYFVNIGDSRGYLIRDGKMRQVTLDHSWVAEQTRAGLLTEEQARTHAHRNVITRSLGTQATVNADLFVETLREGDRVLLCSDGLHGYVDEREIEREMLTHADPEIGARNLIDMANAAGGPDNITAMIVHLLEVPEAVGQVTIPLAGDDPEQTITQPLPAITAKAAAEKAGAALPAAARADAERKARRRQGNRAALIAIRLLAVAALVLLSIGVWDVGFGPFAAARAANQQLQADLDHARQAAGGAARRGPADALAALAQSQRTLLADLDNDAVDDANRASAQIYLNTTLADAVRDSISRYNAAATIAPISLSAITTHDVACGAAGTPALGAPSQLASITPSAVDAGTQPVFAVADGKLYELAAPTDAAGRPSSGLASCVVVPIPDATTVLAIAGDGGKLYALTQGAGTTYTVAIIQEIVPLAAPTTPPQPGDTPPPPPPTPLGTTHLTITQRFTVTTTHGETPSGVAAQGGSIYVAFKGGSAGGAGVWLFSGDPSKGPTQTVTLAQPAVALAATNGTLYAILADGTLGQLDAARKYQALQVPVQAPLSLGNPASYTPASPVPTVAPADAGTSAGTGGQGTAFTENVVLTASPAFPTHVFIGDSANNRVVRLTGSSSGPGLGLARPNGQYVYGPPVAGARQLTIAAAGGTAVAYVWEAPYLVAFALDEPAS
ncbi:MAG TPA: Stp1/IreP family PP2C-type Ser/Thr phosphatase [Ktedonobacterales bacterium]|nr:Stp1/IreP family PP2C-type Ser/Thr phosphatase [Ktedonobacterales bacterium]